MQHSYRLVCSCPDKVGIVAEVSRFIADAGGWLLESSYHADEDSGWFFMRNEIKASSLNISLEEFKKKFSVIAEQFSMNWKVTDSSKPKKVLILASKASHCLADLLHRWHSDDLFCDIPAVISNHENLRSMVEWHEIPYHFLPVNSHNKEASNDEIDRLIEHYAADVIVLARYMQIIPVKMCQRHAGKIINIHHSFLPSFSGANPYQRAHERGVKLMGATCHYVTQELDEGPIIEQDVMRVNHRHSKEAMVRLGKDVEASVLARGLRYHLEDRVIIHGNKTVILD